MGGDFPERLAYLLVPRFSMMSFTASIEAYRSANRVSGRHLYDWQLLTVDGQPVEGGNGIAIMPHGRIGADGRFDTIIVCAGLDPQTYLFADAIAWLRRWASRGVTIGGLCTGTYLLAQAGLLDGYRCTVHWENLPGFLETYPELNVTTRVFEVDRNRFTCAGGTTALDMTLHLIGTKHGPALKAAVSEQFVHTMPREGAAPQRMDLRQRIGVSHPKLLAAIREIEAHLDEPLTRKDLADRIGLSTRQLERLFRVYLAQTPTRYYLEARLRHARQLLSQTSLSILEVALASGFASASHFAKSYRALFGHPPRQERALPAPRGATPGRRPETAA